MSYDLPKVARRALGLLDLTSLGDDDDERVILDLCARALTPHGQVAAVCLYPKFIPVAKRALAGTEVRIATVANFPAGENDLAAAVAQVEQAVADGADEVDVVVPYHAYLASDREALAAMVAACKAACGGRRLKTILETGQLASRDLITRASQDAIAAGSDFLKTSTGKTSPGATLDATWMMLEAIQQSGRRDIGIKPSGGIRTTREAADYLALADGIMGADWVGPETFRFGASALLDDLLGQLRPAAGD